MSEVSEIEGLQLQIEELRAQLNTFKLGETVELADGRKTFRL